MAFVETKRVAAFSVGLARNCLKNVLRVILEHLLGLFGKLLRIVLVRLVQFFVCGCTGRSKS